MNVKDVEALFDYCCWANRKHFGVVSQLTPEEFTQPVAGGYGSIRNTLVHVLSAEWGWLERAAVQNADHASSTKTILANRLPIRGRKSKATCASSCLR